MAPDPSRDPKIDERASLHVHLVREADSGRFDDLECPSCRQHAVSVWFTCPAADTYRIWFLCGKCDFHSRAQATDKPRFFSEARVRKDLEARDLSILQAAIFRKTGV